MTNKFVIINRAIPGSGKSTITRKLTEWILGHAFSLRVHSTDNFFMEGIRYNFDITKLGTYHKENLDKFRESLDEAIDFVVCDNTNLAPWETKPYTDLARKYGYKIVLLNFFPRELIKHIESQKISESRPDAHQDPDKQMELFFETFYEYNSLLGKDSTLDPSKHRNYKWDFVKNQKMDLGPLKYKFDIDTCINIQPNDYHELKEDISPLINKIIEA